MSLPIDLVWHFYTFGSNWGTKHSVTTGGKVFDMHDMLDWERNRNRACGSFRRTGTSLHCGRLSPRAIKYTEFCLFPSCTETLFHHNLFHNLHRSQSPKKGPRHKQNKLSKLYDLKRGNFKEMRICLLGLKEKKNMSVSQEMDISLPSEQSHNTRSVPSLANVPLPISHADCDSYVFRFSLRKPSMREWLHIST